jgi:holliday junction DNA helicase RuvA
MIGSLRGTLLDKKPGQILLEVQGVGYEIAVSVSSYERLPEDSQEAQVFVCESMGMYGGGITLYGFTTLEEKEIFLLLREIPGTGAKKAMDYLDKISKSPPDFRRAMIDGDSRALVGFFGFTKKTADKMIAALKEKIAGLRVSGREKFSVVAEVTGFGEAIAALITLGYREGEARGALDRLPAAAKSDASTPHLIREALKLLGS